MAQNESNDTIYFMQVLAGIGILGLVVNMVFKNAYFLSMCIIFACMLGLLLVQFEMTASGMSVSGGGIIGFIKKLFHFRTLIMLIVLTGWVFDIYINFYEEINKNKMPATFYSVSTAYMWIVVSQMLMIVGNFIKKKKDVREMAKGSTNPVYTKMSKLYSAQHSSINAILTVVNFMLVLVLYVNSQLFVTDG